MTCTDDVRHRLSRHDKVWRRQSFPSRAAAVTASWVPVPAGARAKLEAHDRDSRCLCCFVPPDNSLAAMRAISFQLCPQSTPDMASHMTLRIVSLGSPDGLRSSLRAQAPATRQEATRTHAVSDSATQRCAYVHSAS